MKCLPPDLYRPMHKALRAALFDTALRLGRLDVEDADDMRATLGQSEQVLALMVGHLKHENDFVHTAIEARLPGAARRSAGGHQGHLEEIAGLGAEIDHLRGAAPSERDVIAQRLYLHFSRFVGDNLEQMLLEETDNNATLWSLYGSDELLALQERLLASIAPAELPQVIGWMARALNPAELKTLPIGLQATAPSVATAQT